MTVAALYVDPKGVYAGLPDVEVWDEERDARNYAGPWPVVAHPPCARWCATAALVEKRYGYRRGDDGGVFAAALQAVRTWGGILEHPAGSRAWVRYALPRPTRHGWSASFTDPGYSTEVDQYAYGHRGRKRTWLYYVGNDPPALDWREAPDGLPQVSGLTSNLANGQLPEDRRIRPAEAQATPPAFRDALLKAARHIA